MKIRRMTKKDRPQYNDLCRHAFGMSTEHTDRLLDWVWQHNNTLGAFDGSKLAAGMWYNPFEMRVGEGCIPMAGVSAVATWPEYRKLGLAKQLMSQSQRHMRKNGCPTSSLIPFKFSFYEHMGYAHALDVLVCEFDPQRIRNFPDEGYEVREIGTVYWRDLEKVHLESGRRYNGTLKRDRFYWQKICLRKESGFNRKGYLVFKGKTPCGQVILSMKEPREYFTSEMTVLFLGWTEPGAARAIFRFIRSHSDQMKNVKVFLPPDVRVHQYFERPRITVKLEPKMMFKLVDAVMAVKLRLYSDVLSSSAIIKITGDSTAPWNGGVYDLSFDRGHGRMVKRKSSRKPPRAVQISIQALSQLYIGYYSIEELAGMKAITGPANSLELLGQAFPPAPCYIEDWY